MLTRNAIVIQDRFPWCWQYHKYNFSKYNIPSATMDEFFALPRIIVVRDVKQSGTIDMLTKCRDTTTKLPTIHFRTSTTGFHMAPATWSHRYPTIGVHSTNNIILMISHDPHYMTSQDPNHKTPQDYSSIALDTNHMTSQDTYHSSPNG